ncbi:phosphatase PAP2 family protein [Mycoplasmatota bacterium WC30]
MNFEIEIIYWLQNLRNDFLDALFQVFTILGEEVVLIVILGFVYWCVDKKIGERIGLTVFVSLGLNSVLKLIFMRPRPFMVDNNITNLRPETSQGYSFPSGHTQTAATSYFSLYYFFKKHWLLVVAIIITVLVAISRMYIGVHYFTDVLAGAALGIGIPYLMVKVFEKVKNLKPLYLVLLVLSLLTVIVVIVLNFIRNNNAGVIDAYQLYFDSEGIAKMCGTLSGFILAIFYEKKYTNFSNHRDLKKNIIRFIIGLVIILATRYLLKFIFGFIVDPEVLIDGEGFKSILAIIFDYIRYLAMLLIGIGIYPKLFKKIKI